MTDQAFETRLAAVLRTDAERAVRPIDPVEIATTAAAAGARSRPWRLTGWPQIGQPLRMAFLLLLLLLAVAASAWVLASGVLQRQPLVEVLPSTSPATVDLAAELAGTWLADQPVDLSIGTAGGRALLSLVVDGNGANAWVTTSIDSRERLPASLSALAADELRFVTRAAGDPVTTAGTTLRGCAPGEVGMYRAIRSDAGNRLTLTRIDDPCPSRAAVLMRTFMRSLGGVSRGGSGVVDAFDPLFTVTIPTGSYSADRSTDAITIIQPLPEFQFLAFKDPQGFIDPCDIAAGRRTIEPGADAFVAYFQQLDGFTVDSVTELRVDGHRAVRLLVHANVDATCPSGGLIEWQPKQETSDRSWFLRPGDSDSLYIVELPDSTVMFEVLPAPHALEDQVIGSIRFLDQLPTTP